MCFEIEFFKRKRVDFDKLTAYGFKKEADYKLTKTFLDGAFRAEIFVDADGKVSGKVFESDFGEEYTAFRVKERTGAFVGSVRSAYAEILTDVAAKCFTEEYFVSAQSNRLAERIKKEFGDNPDFPWDDLPDAGVFRNPENKKWYALIMNIDGDRLGIGKGGVDVMNVKLDTEKIAGLLTCGGYFPAYHMNKKYWITLILNDTLPDDEIMERLKESRSFTLKRRK